MKTTGIINGQTVEIQSNEIGTHFFVDGKRIPKKDALEAIEKARSGRAVTTASKNKKVVTIDDVKAFVRVARTTKPADGKKLIDTKLDLLKEVDSGALQLFLKAMRNKTAVGFSGKRLGKWVRANIDTIVGDTLDAVAMGEVLDDITSKGTRFELTKGERDRLVSLIPTSWTNDDTVLFDLGQILSGKVKLGVPSRLL